MTKSVNGFNIGDTVLDTVATMQAVKGIRKEILRQFKPDIPVIPKIDTAHKEYGVQFFGYWSGQQHIMVMVRVGALDKNKFKRH